VRVTAQVCDYVAAVAFNDFAAQRSRSARVVMPVAYISSFKEADGGDKAPAALRFSRLS